METSPFFASRRALAVIEETLTNAQQIRIATAYWEASGYACLAHALRGKEVALLVGRPQGGADNIEEVVRDFVESLAAPPLERRTEALQTLLDGLRHGRMHIAFGDTSLTPTDGRYAYHHAKLYIADVQAAVVTSANLSRHGLKISREAGIRVVERDDVAHFVACFDDYFAQAQPLNELLIAQLEAYLRLHDPFWVYATTLTKLYKLPDAPVPAELPSLAQYQQAVVARCYQALLEHNGAMLVASTGLGKTVMAAHIVAYLNYERHINRVIVICPAGLREQWHRFMRMAAVSSEGFSYQTLSLDANRSYSARNLEGELQRVGSNVLLILDESHHMRNADDDNDAHRRRYRHKRISRAIHGHGGRILMLTATPFSRDVEDINAQLRLLPRSVAAHPRHILKREDAAHWAVDNAVQLSELAPCAVLTTPSVVQQFSHEDEGGSRAVHFSDTMVRYFPRALVFHTQRYANPLDALLQALLDGNLLEARPKDVSDEQLAMFAEEEVPSKKVGLFRANLMREMCSSAGQALDAMTKMRNDSYGQMRFARPRQLQDFVDKHMADVKALMHPDRDPKLRRVIAIVEDSVRRGLKVIIFCHYIETAKMLADIIAEHASLPLNPVRVATTANQDPDQADRTIRQFAPVANDVHASDPEGELNVLVATGALAEGYNLQDASVLVNFDLPWTVLVLAQRLGRILRPWQEPRDIHIYNFIPSTMENSNIPMAGNWLRRLRERDKQHQAIADVPTLGQPVDEDDPDEHELALIELAAQKNILHEGEMRLNFEEVLAFVRDAQALETSTFWVDLAALGDDERSFLQALPPGIRSARSTPNGPKRLFVLFQHGKKYTPVMFDAHGQIDTKLTQPDEIVRAIRCARAEPLPELNDTPLPSVFDDWLDSACHTWAQHQGMDDATSFSLKIVCAMALIPRQKQASPR